MRKTSLEKAPYQIKIKVSVVITLSFVTLLFRFFPNNVVFTRELIVFQINEDSQINLIDITRQESSPALPSRPMIQIDPQFTTLDIIDPQIDQLFNIPLEIGDALPFLGTVDGNTAISVNPQRIARVSRIVEPVTPTRVIQLNQQFRVYVRFLIDSNGSVEEIFITEIQQFNEQAQRFITTRDSQQDIAEATMAAAIQWRFRPAEDNGVPVRSMSTHLFTFGR
jgi:hypothetical protein